MIEIHQMSLVGTNPAATVFFTMPFEAYILEVTLQSCLSHSAAASLTAGLCIDSAVVSSGANRDLILLNTSLDGAGQIVASNSRTFRSGWRIGRNVAIFLSAAPTAGVGRAAGGVVFTRAR